MRTLIADDEPLARDRIRDVLAARPEISVIGEAADGEEAVERIVRERPDLVLLDVQMPSLDGFGVLQALTRKETPLIIFVTAYDQYALRAFEASAVDYVLKPFERSRLLDAVGRAQTFFAGAAREAEGEKIATLLESLPDARRHRSRFAVKSRGRVLLIRAEDVNWVESEGNYVRLHTSAGSHLLRETMNNLERSLDDRVFVRIHRTCIINLDRVRELHCEADGEHSVILEDGTSLALGRIYRPRLESTLGARI